MPLPLNFIINVSASLQAGTDSSHGVSRRTDPPLAEKRQCRPIPIRPPKAERNIGVYIYIQTYPDDYREKYVLSA
ncbi:MAG: hypothetical protein AAB019_02740 [Planctomycetota bacterium]